MYVNVKRDAYSAKGQHIPAAYMSLFKIISTSVLFLKAGPENDSPLGTFLRRRHELSLLSLQFLIFPPLLSATPGILIIFFD